MSKATKKKYVAQEVLLDYVLPTEQQKIVRILGTRGNNLHEVETDDGEQYLVSMPTKFRRNIWIKKGDFVIVSPIDEGDKVRGEISHILYKDQMKYIQSEGLWPSGFTAEHKVDSMADMMPPSDSDSNDDDANCNPNRRPEVPVHELTSSDEDPQ